MMSVMTISEWAEYVLTAHDLHVNLRELNEYVGGLNATNKH